MILKIITNKLYKHAIEKARDKERTATRDRVTKELSILHREEINNLKSEFLTSQIDYESDIRSLEIQNNKYRKDFRSCEKVKRKYREKYKRMEDLTKILEFALAEWQNKTLNTTKDLRIFCNEINHELNTSKKLIK